MTRRLLGALLCFAGFTAHAADLPVMYSAYLVEVNAPESATPEQRWRDAFTGEQVAYSSDPEGFSGNALFAAASAPPKELLRRMEPLGLRKWEGPMAFSSDLPSVKHSRAETTSFIAGQTVSKTAHELALGQVRTTYAISASESSTCPRGGLNLSVDWSKVNGWYEVKKKGQSVQQKPFLVRYKLAQCITLPPGRGMLIGALPLNEMENGQPRELAILLYRVQ